MSEDSLFLSCFAFNSAFVANVASFAFKSELFTRLEVSDLSDNLFFLSLHQEFVL